MTIPVSKQKGYNNEYGRYWTKPILKINGKHYIICSQWFKEFQNTLYNWINRQRMESSVSKMNVYVLSKNKTKTCLKCGNKTEKEMLHVVYHTNTSDIDNQLFTRRCKTCDITYMADSIFKSYTKNKEINNINVNFIKKDT